MAKLKGPCFSIDARGKLGNSLVFSSNKGIKRASRHYSPTNPRTITQQDNRSIFAYAILSWQSLDEGQKQDYNQSAKNLDLKMSGYNYYLQTYLAAYGVAPPPEPTYILDGLVSWWRMDENIGDNVSDSIGPNHGTRYGPTWIAGKHNSALSFDGIDNKVNVGHDNSLDLDALTICAWVYITDNTAARTVIGVGQNAPGHFQFRLLGGSPNNYFYLYGKEGAINWNAVGGTPILLDEDKWYFVTGTCNDGARARTYVDAVLSTENTGNPDVTHRLTLGEAYDVLIGEWNSGRYFHGIIDEVAIYNRELTQPEIQQNYEAFL